MNTLFNRGTKITSVQWSRGISSIDELSDERKNPMENLKTLIRRVFFLITIL